MISTQKSKIQKINVESLKRALKLGGKNINQFYDDALLQIQRQENCTLNNFSL